MKTAISFLHERRWTKDSKTVLSAIFRAFNGRLLDRSKPHISTDGESDSRLKMIHPFLDVQMQDHGWITVSGIVIS